MDDRANASEYQLRFVQSPRKLGLIFVAIVGSIVLQFVPSQQLQSKTSRIMRDFSAFYAAGTIVREGEGDRLYDPSVQYQIERKLTMRPDQEGFLSYPHAPFEALFFALFSVFSYSVATWIWWVCNVGFGFATLLMLRPHLSALQANFGLVFLALGLFFPMLIAEAQGQDSVLSLFLFTLAFESLNRNRYMLAGVFLGLITYKPQLVLPAILILLFTAKKRSSILAGFVITCLGLVLLAAAAIGWRSTLAYPEYLARFKPMDPLEMPNIFGVVNAIFRSHPNSNYILFVTSFLSIAILVVTCWLLNFRQSNVKSAYTVLITATLLIAYHTYVHDMTVLLLPLLFVWNWLAETGLNSKNRKLLATCLVLLSALPMFYWSPQIYAYALMAFLAALWWEVYRDGFTDGGVERCVRI
jgi:hypothetical protein